ncbi:MAG: PhzF family phenazine biosynthesis protein [Halobacteriales archaeon]
MSHPLHVVDVFAERKYAGNQLAVVRDAADLSGEEMQAIAREMAYSETTFVESTKREAGGGWDVRIFTPTEELPFAGHPTLGTAHVIHEHLAENPDETVRLNLGVGQVPIRAETVDGAATLWMTQQSPEFGVQLDRQALANVLSLSEDALATDYPIQIVSTGLATIVVPLRDGAALTCIEIDRNAYRTVTGDREAKLVLAVAPDPRDDANDLAVRVFAPGLGVPEDPATGSANGCLAAYLARHRYLGGREVDARVEQGHELDRPSLLYLRAGDAAGPDDPGDAVTVEVGGSVQPVVEGRLL